MPDSEYPSAYLVARMYGRRAGLVHDYRALIRDPQSIGRLSSGRYTFHTVTRSPRALWVSLLNEYRWVYSQMNSTLRRIFAPFFFYNELRTIFTCLTLQEKKESGQTAAVLAQSILSLQFKRVLREGKDSLSTFRSVEAILLSLSPAFSGISDIFEKDGIRAAEKTLTNRYLVHAVQYAEHAVIRAFFSHIIDARNIITLYKTIRHAMHERPAFVLGGSITGSRLVRSAENSDLKALTNLLYGLAGIRPDTPDPASVERTLYAGITKKLRREGKTEPVIGIILSYLWQRSLETMNLGVIFQGRALDRDTVTGEIVV